MTDLKEDFRNLFQTICATLSATFAGKKYTYDLTEDKIGNISGWVGEVLTFLRAIHTPTRTILTLEFDNGILNATIVERSPDRHQILSTILPIIENFQQLHKDTIQSIKVTPI